MTIFACPGMEFWWSPMAMVQTNGAHRSDLMLSFAWR